MSDNQFIAGQDRMGSDGAATKALRKLKTWRKTDRRVSKRAKDARICPPSAPKPLKDSLAVLPGAFTTEGGKIKRHPKAVQAYLPRNAVLDLSMAQASENFDAEFLMRAHGGDWCLTYDPPSRMLKYGFQTKGTGEQICYPECVLTDAKNTTYEGRAEFDSVWELRFKESGKGGSLSMVDTRLSRSKSRPKTIGNGWLHVRIKQRKTTTTVRVRDRSGRHVSSSTIHSPAPAGGSIRWWGGSKGADLDVAHFSWHPLEDQAPTGHVRAVKKFKASGPAVRLDRKKGRVTLSNGRLELVVETGNGVNPNSLHDLKTGRVYADADYVWPCNNRPKLKGKPVIKKNRNGACSAAFTSTSGPLEITQTYSAPANDPDTITETIHIRNTGPETLEMPDFACGFAKKMVDRNGSFDDALTSRVTAIPYRVNSETGEHWDYAIPELAVRQCWFSYTRLYDGHYSDTWGDEGWVWYQGEDTLLIQKYNNDSMEWSLLKPAWRPTAGARSPQEMKLGDPEGAASLKPGTSFTFGVTRIKSVHGGWKQAFYAFRDFLDRNGHSTPKGFNPHVQWNVLYDAGFAYHSKTSLVPELEKAREIGCEAIYLDPRWDTAWSSSIWAEDRLGKQKDFVRILKKEYGFKGLALHTPLAPWTNASTYSGEARVMNKDGSRGQTLCGTSRQYIKEKTKHLRKLGKDGAFQFLYDGNWFEGGCYDPNHGHSIPNTRQEWLDAQLKLSRTVHETCPDVLVELHDPIIGPGVPRYAPTYILYGKRGSFDELWAYEFMITPDEDLNDGRALCLYYINLACNMPIYVHTDLHRDTETALHFWWFASTCRHLGFGGRSPKEKIWNTHKKAMKTYMHLKEFFTQGAFYGIDEMIHVHTLSKRKAAVINCFNLHDSSSVRYDLGNRETRRMPASIRRERT